MAKRMTEDRRRHAGDRRRGMGMDAASSFDEMFGADRIKPSISFR
jgi:hypothetical protein